MLLRDEAIGTLHFKECCRDLIFVSQIQRRGQSVFPEREMEEFFHPAFPGGKFQLERFFHRFAGLVPTADPDIQCQRTDRVVQRQFQRITFSRLENSRIQTFPQVWIRVPKPPEIAFLCAR